MLVPLVPGRGFEPRSPVLQTGAVTRSAFRAEFGADAGNRNRAFGVALRNSTVELGPHGGKWRESNFRPAKGTAFTAPRRHQPSLWALPEKCFAHSRAIWRKVKESNHRRFRRPGFRDQLPATGRHLPCLGMIVFPKTAAHFSGSCRLGVAGWLEHPASRSGTVCSSI